jgi:probable O-glycosylation ligase (exosortase A-associated)
MILCGVSVLGSHSRGALLAISAMLMFLWWRSRAKLPLALALVVLAPVLIAFMPDHWTARMSTIRDYEQDTSAMERINAWQTAINVTNDRPITGGGFVINTYETFAKYAPDPTRVHAAHSIYFQVLGEHGYVGLLLFLLMWFLTWRSANKLIASGRSRPDLQWASQLGAMIQVSIVGYAVGGAFLNLAYWDFPYYEIIAIVIARDAVRTALATESRGESPGADAGIVAKPVNARTG